MNNPNTPLYGGATPLRYTSDAASPRVTASGGGYPTNEPPSGPQYGVSFLNRNRPPPSPGAAAATAHSPMVPPSVEEKARAASFLKYLTTTVAQQPSSSFNNPATVQPTNSAASSGGGITDWGSPPVMNADAFNSTRINKNLPQQPAMPSQHALTPNSQQPYHLHTSHAMQQGQRDVFAGYVSSPSGTSQYDEPLVHVAEEFKHAVRSMENGTYAQVLEQHGYHDSQHDGSKGGGGPKPQLSTAEIIRRQQDALAQKKAANVQRWLGVMGNVPPELQALQQKAAHVLSQQQQQQQHSAQKQLTQHSAPPPPPTLTSQAGNRATPFPPSLANCGVTTTTVPRPVLTQDTDSASPSPTPIPTNTVTPAETRIPQPPTKTATGPTLAEQMMEASRNADLMDAERRVAAAKTAASAAGGRGRGGFGARGGRGGGKTSRAGKDNQDHSTDDEGGGEKGTPQGAKAARTETGGRGRGGKGKGTKATAQPPATDPLLQHLTTSTTTFSFLPNRTMLFGSSSAATTAAIPLAESVTWAMGTHSPSNLPQGLLRLFRFLHEELDDPSRIQVPVVCAVAEIQLSAHSSSKEGTTRSAVANEEQTPQNESSFSLSTKYDGKIIFTTTDSPRDACNMLNKTFIYYHDQVFELDQHSSFFFFNELISKMEEVELVTFHASALLMPLLAYNGGVLSTNRLTDLRVMGWMLNPSDSIACFDTLQMAHTTASPSQLASNSRNGILQRLPAMLSLYRKLYGNLGHQGLLQPFMRQEKGIGLLCCIMKYNGFCIRTDIAERCRAVANQRMDALKAKAEDIIRTTTRFFVTADTTFNIQSPDDIREVLYTHLSLGKYLEHSTAVANTKGGKMSTAEDALRCLIPYSFLPAVILEYRKIAKLAQTYFNGVLATENLFPFHDDRSAVHQGSIAGRGGSTNSQSTLSAVHANFLQEATDTGRLSCVEPNLQNLPRAVAKAKSTDNNKAGAFSAFAGYDDIDEDAENEIHDDNFANFGITPILASATEAQRNSSSPSSPTTPITEASGDTQLSTAVRRSFVARPGHTLIAIDYEQIELRVLAHFCQDQTLIGALSSNEDIHRRIAAAVFRKPVADVTSEERSQAKPVVFGTVYGMGAKLLAAQTGMSLDRASKIQSDFRRAFPTIERYQQKVIDKCRQDKLVRTISGRSRPLPEIDDPNPVVKSQAARQAFNTLIQGSAADIVKKAMSHVFYSVLSVYGDPSVGIPAPEREVDPKALVIDRPLLLCQIHDELVFSVPSTVLSKVVPALRTTMVNCFSLSVPLKVSVRYGQSLGTLRDWPVDGDLGLLDKL